MTHNFGDPFLLMLGAEETAASVRTRVQAKVCTVATRTAALRVPSLALLFVRAVACTLRPLLCCTFAACSRRPPLRSAAKQLGLSDEEIAKWKLAVVSFGRVEYLEEDEVVKQRFRKHDNYGNWDDYLGLEHAQVPGSGRKKHAARTGYADKPVKIYG